MVGHLAEDVVAVPRLAPVDPDRALAPAAPDPGRLQPRIGLDGSLDEPPAEVLLVPRPERDVLGRVGHGHELGEGRCAVVVAQVEEDVGDRDPERLGHRRRAAGQPRPC